LDAASGANSFAIRFAYSEYRQQALDNLAETDKIKLFNTANKAFDEAVVKK
jgi:hypothetical protein